MGSRVELRQGGWRAVPPTMQHMNKDSIGNAGVYCNAIHFLLKAYFSEEINISSCAEYVYCAEMNLLTKTFSSAGIC